MNAFELFTAHVKAAQEQAVKDWDIAFLAITGGNKEVAVSRCQDFNTSLEELHNLIKANGTPKWLGNMLSSSAALSSEREYSQAQERRSHIRILLKHESSLRQFSITSAEENSSLPLLDLDAVIEKHHDRLKINQLYNDAIKLIKDALESNSIDSNRISKDLSRILASIRSAKKASFITQLFEVGNLVAFLKAVATASAKRVPVIGELLAVMQEANESLQANNDEIMSELRSLREEQALILQKYLEAQPLLIAHEAAKEE